MADRFDVIVVGARCAGAPLATLLARKGLRVAVVERATFPRDTLSTHVFQAQALEFLDRLGVIEKVRATGAPFLDYTDGRQEDLELRVWWPHRPSDPGGITSVRRLLLDPILAEAAAASGAEVRMGTKVTGLVKGGGRVRGVRVTGDGSEGTLEGRLVVGADGRNSTIGQLVGARKYNVTPNERFAYWAFFEGADPGSDPGFVFHRWEDRIVIATPADSGLYQVVLIPDLKDLPRFRQDLEGSFMEYALSCRPVAQALNGSRRVGKFFGMLRFEGFFREASGPGWVLVGDAGHFKDPTPGQGIQDAFRQVDALAPVIAEQIESSDEDLDRALADWGRWRDEDAAEHYWFATDLGKAGSTPAPVLELIKGLLTRGKAESFMELFNHRTRPSKVFTAPRLLGATTRLMLRRGTDRRAVLREVRELVAEDARRRRHKRRPLYVAPEVSLDAGATEVDEGTPEPVS